MSNLRLNELWSMHAEIHALGRVRHLNLRGTTIYVATKRAKTQRIVLSKPCLTCAVALRTAGVLDCYFTVTQSNDFDVDFLDLEKDLLDLKLYSANGHEGL